MDGHGGQQLLDELLTLRPSLRRAGARRSVDEFDQSHYGEPDRGLTDLPRDEGQHLVGVLPLAFRCDQNAGIKDQSHAGGFSASRWLAIATSTSLANTRSIVAVESSSSSAIHSQIVRCGRRTTTTNATGSVPCSSRTSPPTR